MLANHVYAFTTFFSFCLDSIMRSFFLCYDESTDKKDTFFELCFLVMLFVALNMLDHILVLFNLCFYLHFFRPIMRTDLCELSM